MPKFKTNNWCGILNQNYSSNGMNENTMSIKIRLFLEITFFNYDNNACFDRLEIKQLRRRYGTLQDKNDLEQLHPHIIEELLVQFWYKTL